MDAPYAGKYHELPCLVTLRLLQGAQHRRVFRGKLEAKGFAPCTSCFYYRQLQSPKDVGKAACEEAAAASVLSRLGLCGARGLWEWKISWLPASRGARMEDPRCHHRGHDRLDLAPPPLQIGRPRPHRMLSPRTETGLLPLHSHPAFPTHACTYETPLGCSPCLVFASSPPPGLCPCSAPAAARFLVSRHLPLALIPTTCRDSPRFKLCR